MNPPVITPDHGAEMEPDDNTFLLLGRAQGAIHALEQQAAQDRATNASQFAAIQAKFDDVSRHLEGQDGKLDTLIEQNIRAAGRAEERAQTTAHRNKVQTTIISILGLIAAFASAFTAIQFHFMGL